MAWRPWHCSKCHPISITISTHHYLPNLQLPLSTCCLRNTLSLLQVNNCLRFLDFFHITTNNINHLEPKIYIYSFFFPYFFHYIYCTNVYLLDRLCMHTVTTKHITMGTTPRWITTSPPHHQHTQRQKGLETYLEPFMSCLQKKSHLDMLNQLWNGGSNSSMWAIFHGLLISFYSTNDFLPFFMCQIGIQPHLTDANKGMGLRCSYCDDMTMK